MLLIHHAKISKCPSDFGDASSNALNFDKMLKYFGYVSL